MSGTVSKKTLMRFSSEEDETLIKFVENYPVLYNQEHADFKNNMKKSVLWTKAGKLLNRDGDECKRRWKTIRDNHKREKRYKRTSSANVTKKKRATYWKLLKFLDVYDQISNRSINTVQDSNSDISSDDQEDDCASTDSFPIDQSIEDASTNVISENSHSSLSKTKFENSISSIHSAGCRDERDQGWRLVKLMKKHSSDSSDETDLFFRTLAVTVKKFKPELIIQTKAKLFEIVTEMELLNREGECKIDSKNQL